MSVKYNFPPITGSVRQSNCFYFKLQFQCRQLLNKRGSSVAITTNDNSLTIIKLFIVPRIIKKFSQVKVGKLLSTESPSPPTSHKSTWKTLLCGSKWIYFPLSVFQLLVFIHLSRFERVRTWDYRHDTFLAAAITWHRKESESETTFFHCVLLVSHVQQ